MITEKAPRQCRFSKYGCGVKMRRAELQLHEAKCPERTVRCPAPVFCDKFVQIKHCDEHLQSHLPSMWIHDSPNKSFVNTTVVNCGMNSPYLRDWDGKSRKRGEEFDLNRKDIWSLQTFTQMGRIFYLREKYFAPRQCFLMMVLVADLPEVAAEYIAHFNIRSEETGVEVDYKCPVVSVEEMDSSHTPLTEMFDEARCWKVPYYTMKSLFRFYNWNGQYECNKMEWRVSYCTEINITSKIEAKRPKIRIRK